LFIKEKNKKIFPKKPNKGGIPPKEKKKKIKKNANCLFELEKKEKSIRL
jgi:hypothetical protein